MLGLFGAGFQGRNQVAAIREVRDIRSVKIFDLSSAAAESLAESLRADGVEATVSTSPEEVVRGSDVIASATTAKEPPILGAWLEPGVHVNAAGANAPVKREVDPEGFARARVVVDFREQVLGEAGDLMHALESGAIEQEDVAVELGEVVTGAKPGRASDDEITLFKSVGVAIEDVAVASYVYQTAKEKGLGLDLALQS